MNILNEWITTCALSADVNVSNASPQAAPAQTTPAQITQGQATCAQSAFADTASDEILGREQRCMQSLLDMPERVSSLSGDALAANGLKMLRDWSFGQVIAWINQNKILRLQRDLRIGTVGGACGLEYSRFLNHDPVAELKIGEIQARRNRILRDQTHRV